MTLPLLEVNLVLVLEKKLAVLELILGSMNEIVLALKAEDPCDDVLRPHQSRRFLSFASPNVKAEDERFNVEETRCIDVAPRFRIPLPSFEILQKVLRLTLEVIDGLHDAMAPSHDGSSHKVGLA